MNYLLLNLAIADIMYATFIAPRVYFKLTFNHPDGVIGTFLCKFVTDGSVAWIGGASSIVTLTAIAIERYYAVIYPHGNKWKLTEHKLKVSPNDTLQVLLLLTAFLCRRNLRMLSSSSACLLMGDQAHDIEVKQVLPRWLQTPAEVCLGRCRKVGLLNLYAFNSR